MVRVHDGAICVYVAFGLARGQESFLLLESDPDHMHKGVGEVSVRALHRERRIHGKGAQYLFQYV